MARTFSPTGSSQRRSIEEPLRQIVENAGEDAAVVLNTVKAGKGAYGYNAGTGEYGDMPEEGILDPAKVTRLPCKHLVAIRFTFNSSR